MAELEPSGLRTHDYASPGWNITYNNNFEIINNALGSLISEEKVNIVDLNLVTENTDQAGANYTSSEQQMINNLVSDVVQISEKVNELYQALRSLGILNTE